VSKATSSERGNSEEQLLVGELTHRMNNEFAEAIAVLSLAAARSSNGEVKRALAMVEARLHSCMQVNSHVRMPSRDTIIDASAHLWQRGQSISRSRLDYRGRETVLYVGPLELDLIERSAKRQDRAINLLPREFRLLQYMMRCKEQVLTRAQLLEEVWNYKFVPETNLVDVHLGRLRRKVDGPHEFPMIHNVRGMGFILRAPR
jgi:DNA-binding response OmpR family regulator